MLASKALYFAAIVPPEDLKEEVRKIKMEIKEKFGAAHALKLPAHITLVPPIWLPNENELPFLNAIGFVARDQSSIRITLEDFGHFGQRAIYIKVKDHDPLQRLHQKLSKELKEFISVKTTNNLHPHITIATRDLTRENFQNAWKEIKNRTFISHFVASSVVVFKHNGKAWEVLKIISFKE